MDVDAGEENIKPLATDAEVEKIVATTYGLKGGTIQLLQGYDDLNYFCLPRASCNPFIETPWHHGYVLKIMNSLDSEKKDLAEAQNAIMFHLRVSGITSPIPVQTMRGDYYVSQKFRNGKKEHVVRLLEFQPGTVLRKQVVLPSSLLYKLGMFLGDLNHVLKKFSHPFYDNYSSVWHLNSVPALKSMTLVIEDEERKRMVHDVIEKFTRDVLEEAESFEKGMIHGDFNEHNILLNKNKKTGELDFAILDFGDSHRSCYLFELGIALCYIMMECKGRSIDPVAGAGHVLAGYLAVRSAFSASYGLLKLCICARLCQSLVLGLKAHRLHPENNYVMDSQEKGWPLLEELWNVSDESITRRWNSIVRLYDAESRQELDAPPPPPADGSA